MFSERLEILRLKKELTHQQMADMLGVTRQAYSNYENGKREPDFATLEKLANFFKVSTDYLLGRPSDPSVTHAAEETPSYEPKTPNIDSIYQAKTLAEAIIRIEKMRREFGLSKEWMYEMWDKAIEVYGQPEGKGGVAAHGPSYPGSGALNGGDEPR